MALYKTYSEKETRAIGAKLAEKISKAKGKPQTVLLSGDLGAGKTAFSKGFAGFFGVKKVLSPTFNIIRSYRIKKNGYSLLLHADLYRIKSVDELKNLFFFESLKEKGTIAIVEWPEIAGKRIIGTKVSLSHGLEENERLISYT